MEWVVTTDAGFRKTVADLHEQFRQHRCLRVTARSGRTRTISQNSLMHAWYTQMAVEDRQHDLQEHIRYCKWHHGVPILCADDPEYRALCRTLLGPLDYESRLIAMDHYPVTRLMTKAQESKYLQAMQDDYAKRGVVLTFPDNAARAA